MPRMCFHSVGFRGAPHAEGKLRQYLPVDRQPGLLAIEFTCSILWDNGNAKVTGHHGHQASSVQLPTFQGPLAPSPSKCLAFTYGQKTLEAIQAWSTAPRPMVFRAWPVTSGPSPHFVALYQKLRGIGAFLCQEICHGSTNLRKSRIGEPDQSPGVNERLAGWALRGRSGDEDGDAKRARQA